MTDVYDAAIEASLQWAIQHRINDIQIDEAPAAIAIIGMGRYGGREVNFSSDADVIIIYRPAEGADDRPSQPFRTKSARKTYVRSCKVQPHSNQKSNLTWILGLKAKTDRSYVPTHPARNTIDPGQAHGSIRRYYAHDMRQATRLLPRISS